MRTQTLHANLTKTAIGYVQVGTQEQASDWIGRFVNAVLQREGTHKDRPYKSPGPRKTLRHDKLTAATRAHELQAEGLSLRLVGVRRRKEGLVPLRGGK